MFNRGLRRSNLPGQIISYASDPGAVTYGYQIDSVSDRRRIVVNSPVPSGSFHGFLLVRTTSTTFDLHSTVQTSGAAINTKARSASGWRTMPPDGTPCLTLNTACSAA
jgi:hypothetical protein